MSQPPDERPVGLPAHPESDEPPGTEASSTEVNWATVLVFALIGAVVVLILVLHLTGVVGPAGRG